MWAGQHLGPLGKPGARESHPRAGVELGAATASLGVGPRSKPEPVFPSVREKEGLREMEASLGISAALGELVVMGGEGGS